MSLDPDADRFLTLTTVVHQQKTLYGGPIDDNKGHNVNQQSSIAIYYEFGLAT
jgi:hypothetical protein